MGKQSRNFIFKKSTWRVKEVLEFIYSDICGSISFMIISGKRYVMCFIDDYSRKGWVYFLKEKSEVFEYFKMFKKLVEIKISKKIKCLRIDRGGEYISNEFFVFCKEEGVRR